MIFIIILLFNLPFLSALNEFVLNDTGFSQQHGEMLQSCLPVLTRLHEKSEYHTFVGCKLLGLNDLDIAIVAALDVIQCDQISSNFTESIVQNYLLQTQNARKSVKVCIDSDETLTLFIVSITSSSTDKTLTAYFERKRITQQLIPNGQREKIYRVFPRINIKLPSDFFYPFSCPATKPSFSCFILYFSVLLTFLALRL